MLQLQHPTGWTCFASLADRNWSEAPTSSASALSGEASHASTTAELTNWLEEFVRGLPASDFSAARKPADHRSPAPAGFCWLPELPNWKSGFWETWPAELLAAVFHWPDDLGAIVVPTPVDPASPPIRCPLEPGLKQSRFPASLRPLGPRPSGPFELVFAGHRDGNRQSDTNRERSPLSMFERLHSDDLTQIGRHLDTTSRTALAAAIWLWRDDFDQAHELAQQIEGTGRPNHGDYVHAIVHRREPDPGNARYWFRRVARHPVLNRLPAGWEAIRTNHLSSAVSAASGRLPALQTGGQWDSAGWIDWAEHVRRKGSPQELTAALELQQFEILSLIDEIWTNAG